MMRISARLAVLSVFLGAQFAIAGPVAFGPDWKALTFPFISETKFEMAGDRVDITAQNSSSVIYRTLPKADWNATSASWSWETLTSVPPTDLSVKGDDDRNIAIYFVFLDTKTAAQIGRTANIKTLLGAKRARFLIYTFGGDKPRDTVYPNPYLETRGVTIIKRAAITGAFDETVDLAADYRSAFGGAPQALVGVALTSDSDDTDALVLARVSNLRLN